MIRHPLARTCNPTGTPLSRVFLRHKFTVSSLRKVPSESGENKSGHISTAQNEGILFFTNLSALNLRWLVSAVRKVSGRSGNKDQIEDISIASPSKIISNATKDGQVGGVKILEVLPRLKEGGAFVKFGHDAGVSPQSVSQTIRNRLRDEPIRPWWKPWSRVRADLVMGRPWVEDLMRLPSRRLRVEFLPPQSGVEASELSQEQLYSFFRRYGKLRDIDSQASDSKVTPRYAFVEFRRFHKSIMARNCLHGVVADSTQGGGSQGTLLRITCHRQERFHWLKDWLLNHPRIVIPLLAALIAGISFVVFDPLRTLSIKAHITRAFHIEDNTVFKWFKRQGKDIIDRVNVLRRGNDPEAGMSVVWEDRKDEIEQIQAWLLETSDTFIVITGPRGSGKRELVIDHALQHKHDAHKLLVVDCKPIQEARGDAMTISAAAAQVGYRPVFSWVNNISGLVDLAAQGMTGAKVGFSETLENQLVKIYQNTANALKSIALESRKKDDKDANLGEDEYLEAHPETRPVVVIENFLHKPNEPGSQMVYDKLSEWAAQLTTSNIAHVVFLTNDISFSKSLSKALPGRVFRQIALGDCSPDVAKRYVVNHLDFDAEVLQEEKDVDGNKTTRLTPSQERADLKELDEVIGQLGGRLTDLEFLARRIKTGETPSKAVKEIVDQSASEILKMFLLSGAEDRQWTQQQAWTLVKFLAKNETLRYNEVLLESPFSGSGDKVLAALEQAELITVQSANGRPYSVKPGRPVYHPAFKRLVDDTVLAAKMDLVILADSIGSENKSIDKYEQELKLLAELPKQPFELYSRVQWLLAKIKTGQEKVESLEKQTADLKKTLASEF